METITGYPPDDFYTVPDLYETIIHPDDRKILRNHEKTLSSEGHDPLYFRIITKLHTVKWISHVCSAIYDAEGTYRGRRGSNRDVTKRMLAESEVKKLLTEKEYLLKEVHHRIKNNMTTLLSIITLQSDAVENEEAKNALESVEKRVWSMLSLYETLFQAEDFQNVSVKHYLSSLVDSIMATFPEAENITVRKDFEDFKVPAKIILSIGIMVNELITNVMKYAFKSTSSGILKISAAYAHKRIRLVVADNGTGIPDGFDITESDGFGMKLINLMVHQLSGTIHYEREQGTTFIITLPMIPKHSY